MAPPPRFVTYLGARVSVPELARRAGVSTQAMGWRTRNWDESRWMGEKRENKRVTRVEADEIAARMRRGDSANDVAGRFGLSLNWVYRIKNGWRKT